MSRIFYLLRHCKPQLPEGGHVCLGHTDVPLSSEGKQQAQRLAEYFAQRIVTAVYSSDLLRSRQSAEAIACVAGLPLHTRSMLREIDMGQWDGLSFAEIRQRWPQEYERRGSDIWQYRPPGGESFANCAKRSQEALQAIAGETTGSVVLVAHSGFNRALLWQMGLRPLAGLLSIKQHYGGINELWLAADGSWQITTVDRILE